MTIGNYLSAATARLQQAKIDSARLDVLVLLEDILGLDRAHILAHPEVEIASPKELVLNKKIVQRLRHIPLAYLRDQAAFYGRSFVVSPAVLVPRPESETIIDLLKVTDFTKTTQPLHIIDLGSGSGCLGLTAALEIPGAKVELWDIDPQTLAVARKNARLLGVKAVVKQVDLLGEPPQLSPSKSPPVPVDVLLANLPYVPTDYPINEAAQHEPRQAIFSGSDGLGHYRRLWQQISQLPQAQKPRYVFTEALPQQHGPLAKLANQAGYQLSATQDLAQRFQLS